MIQRYQNREEQECGDNSGSFEDYKGENGDRPFTEANPDPRALEAKADPRYAAANPDFRFNQANLDFRPKTWFGMRWGN